MSPAILYTPHEKFPLSAEDHTHFDLTNVLEVRVLHLGPDEDVIQFTLMENTEATKGVVVTELLDVNNQPKDTLGNVEYRIIDASEGDCVGGCAQIKSAFFSANYQGFGYGTESYKMILNHHGLVSDNQQTHDGATFWKFRLGADDTLQIKVAKGDNKAYELIVTDDDAPIIYNVTKTEMESMIWGLDFPEYDTHKSINASKTEKHDDVVLIALRVTD